MSLTAQLEAKRSELAEVKAAVEGGDMEKAAQLSEAIEGVKSIEDAIAEADKADKLLKSLGSVSAKSEEAAPRTLGEFAAKKLDLSAMKSGMSRSAGTGFGFKAATDVHMVGTIAEVSQNVVDYAEFDSVRSLFGTETISGNAITFFQMGATEGKLDKVAEGGAKPQFHVPYTPITAPLQKVAGWFYETDELLNDAPYLVSAINNRGLFELRKQSDLVITDAIFNTSGIQSVSAAGSDITADDIFNAIMNVKSATGYDADAILINPVDYARLRLAKDSNLQYYGGGYFYAPYGNGENVNQPGIWGLRTIVTTAVDENEVLVGAFRAAATVVTKAGEGVGIEVHRGDHDDAVNNRVTVVVEERLALAVRVPQAFAKVVAE